MADRSTRLAPRSVVVFFRVAIVGGAGPLAAGCAHRQDSVPVLPLSSPPGVTPRETATREPTESWHDAQIGYATWYGHALAGRKTASGERFDPSQMTAAHRRLPFGTWVEVQKLDTGEVVRVRITDRGPFGHPDRIIDLSRAAAERIGMLRSGRARVRIRVVDGP